MSYNNNNNEYNTEFINEYYFVFNVKFTLYKLYKYVDNICIISFKIVFELMSEWVRIQREWMSENSKGWMSEDLRGYYEKSECIWTGYVRVNLWEKIIEVCEYVRVFLFFLKI